MCRVTSKLGNDSASANITIVDSNGKRYLLHPVSQSVRGVIEMCGKSCSINLYVKSSCEQIKNMEGKPYTPSILCVFHEILHSPISYKPEIHIDFIFLLQ